MSYKWYNHKLHNTWLLARNVITPSVKTLRFLLKKDSTSTTIKYILKSYDKRNIIVVVISYAIYETRLDSCEIYKQAGQNSPVSLIWVPGK